MSKLHTSPLLGCINVWGCVMLFCVSMCASTIYPYTFSDEKGYTATIPAKPKRIIVGGGMWPMPPIIAMLESSADTLIYIPKASMSAMSHSFLAKHNPLKHIQSGNSENIEELLAMKPDLFICHNASMKLCEAMKKSPIPTIEIGVSAWEYNSYKTLEGWLRVVAPILDATKVAKDVLSWSKRAESGELFEKILSNNTSLQAAQAAAKKRRATLPKALIIHRFEKDRTLQVGRLFAPYLLGASGAQNALDSATGGLATLSMEDLYTIKPDIIYINNFNQKIPQDLYKDPLYAPLNAIKHQHVFKFPLGSYRPFAPGMDLPILLVWLQVHNTFYDDPSALESAMKDVYKLSKTYYKEVFNIDLSEEEIQMVFHPDVRAGALE